MPLAHTFRMVFVIFDETERNRVNFGFPQRFFQYYNRNLSRASLVRGLYKNRPSAGTIGQDNLLMLQCHVSLLAITIDGV